ncbi:MmgE/PrpD family protein [Metapseudomonas furukawaii]|uniref:MmgE/PrpD family protein n=1 Tax=Metapseudomonas furukawaii TaxID=1149133 RepID=A0AAD1C005_METFU|nr:MmgE/PrpD family protein [Pseudomonas furukawaii]ELS27472.1 MmgE/PrpD family protein [Pseudomonas furukawaii]BAU74091.1 MmgE/PrpD family protein [Pseudomonas furukawaii]
MSLYAFVRDFRFRDAPSHTRELLQTCLLDILGVAAGARDNTTSQALKQYALSHYPAGKLASRLLFDGRPVHPLGAAWAGGFSVDSLDAHEGHFTSKGHAGATVVPALLAIVDACREQGRSISGEELLSALCIGYETALRAGAALMATAPEYHASGAFSGVGVVCGGARLLGLDEQRFRHALGIAEYFGPRCPMMRLVDHPSMLRDAHGAGAYAGLNALLLAQAGVTGAPAETVEDEAVAAHWRDIGQRWEIDAQYFKPWPVCRWAQPALTAMTRLMAEYPQIRGENIERIQVQTFHESMRLQGHTPSNADEAQYALAFPLAALVVRGQVGPLEVTGEAIHAPDILAVSQRIDIVESEELSERFPNEILSRVVVQLKDGQALTSPITAAKGDPETAMTRAEFLAKFSLLAGISLAPEQRLGIEQAIAALPGSASCETLFALLFEQAGSPW